jgi:hypothetical protein
MQSQKPTDSVSLHADFSSKFLVMISLARSSDRDLYVSVAPLGIMELMQSQQPTTTEKV